jgi:thiaminase
MKFYDHLVKQTESSREYLLSSPIILHTFKGEISKEDYLSFLNQAYYHVRHTVPLLMAAGSKMTVEQEWLREAIGEYIEEEMGHQEWILDDIEVTGGNKESVRNGMPSMATELMVSYAYDTIHRGNPLGFFGMVLVLEGTSIKLATDAAGIIQKTLGLPAKAFSYLSSHGSLDIEHMNFFETLMNKISEPADQKAIIHAAHIFYHLYADIFRSLDQVALEAA